MEVSDRWALLRHPVSRIISAYYFGWHQKGEGLPLEDWWEHVRQNPSFDAHTQPMVEILDGNFTHADVLEEMGPEAAGMVMEEMGTGDVAEVIPECRRGL